MFVQVQRLTFATLFRTQNTAARTWKEAAQLHPFLPFIYHLTQDFLILDFFLCLRMARISLSTLLLISRL